MTDALTDDAVQKAVAELEGWSFEDNSLRKTFKLGSFKEAVSFIVRLAFHAEEMDHHPEIRNVYSTVDIALTTHDAGDRVTQKDVDLATAIESFAWR